MEERKRRYGLRTVRPQSSASSGASEQHRASTRPHSTGSEFPRRTTAKPRTDVRKRKTPPVSDHPMVDHGGYIPGLDGLRALAVIAVVLYHVFPGAWGGGFLGVDVFFVLSGFLITTLLLREDRKNNSIDLKGFWIRRARRLLPALGVLIITVVPAAWAVHTDLLVGIGRQVIGALTFSTNWVEIWHGSSYFDQTSPLLFKNFWSLAIEEQFYLFWPLIMLVILALVGSWRKRTVFAATIALGSAALMMILYSGDNLTRLYYGTDTHLFGIALGICLAFIWADPKATLLGSHHWQSYGTVYGFISLALVILAFFTIPDTGPWAYMGGMFIISFLVAVLIAATLAPNSYLAQVGELRVLRWIGTRSYGLYLWHWPVLVMAAVLVPVAIDSWSYWLRSAVAILITGIIVELSYRFIETPVRKYGYRETWASFQYWVQTTIPGKIISGVIGLLMIVTVLAIALAPTESSTQQMIEAGEADTKSLIEESGEAETETAENGDDTESNGEATADDADSLETAETAEYNPLVLPEDFDASIPDDNEVTIIGDSMVAASRTGLVYAMPNINVHALSNLQWKDAYAFVEDAIDAGVVGRVVVIDFGTNAGVSDPQVIRDVIHLLGPNRMILLVNLYSPSTFIDESNEVIASVAEEYLNVGLIDWYGMASSDPGLLQVDATHTSIEGANAFGALVKSSITEFATTLSAHQGTDPGQGWGAD
ncbi:MAG: acyltransferase family protein [Actinomycetaceae bacterium]|nr:acyltransferase family protein [Actinomycetaceae bacterium]